MAQPSKPFIFTLTADEVAKISAPVGEGGHQRFHEVIVAQLQKTGNIVTLDDGQFGGLIRHMAQYDSGGFQGRLRGAFIRSIRALLDL